MFERHGIIQEYHINLTEQETETLTTYTSTETSIEISRLHPFYNYTWIVTAVTIGEGPYTASDTVMTLEDGKFVYAKTITITWNFFSSKWCTSRLFCYGDNFNEFLPCMGTPCSI